MKHHIRSGALLALALLAALPMRAAAGQAKSATVRSSPQAGVTVLKDVQRTVMGDIVRVVIELDAEVAYHSERVENPARVLFDLESTRLGPGLGEGTLSYPTDGVRHIRLGRHPNRVVRVVLDLEGIRKYSVFTLYSPYRIVIDCERGPVLAPVPSESIAEEKVRPPISDPADAPAQSKTDVVAAKTDVAPAPPKTDVVTTASKADVAPHQPKTDVAATPPKTDVARRQPTVDAVASLPKAPATVAKPFAPPPASRAVAGRALPRTQVALAPRVIDPAPIEWRAPRMVAAPPAPVAAAAQPRAAAAPTVPVIPLRTTRQFRLTRYPTWQPVVIPPDLRRVAFAAAVPAASPAVSPAVAERTTAVSEKAVPDRTEKAVIASEPVVPPPNGFSMARQLGLGAARIVIDPGHGGHDPGAEGPSVYEAQIVLDIALRLEKLLNAAGIEAVLTRRTDEYIPLEERTAIANRAHGDLFLSIHANASRNRAARGIESYVLNFASTPDAEAVAARENASTGLTMSSLTEIVKAIALNNKLDESRNFAGIIQREMVSHLKGANRDVRNLGVKQAPFVVLIGASMPSVLAEISFITHAQEGRLLKTGAYRQKIAEALFEAIRGYQQSLKGSAVLTRQ